MNNNRIASNSLLKGITYIIKDYIKKSPLDKTVDGFITKVMPENLYEVQIGDKKYSNIPSLFKGLQKNEVVKITIQQNQYTQMFISGKYDMDFVTREDFNKLQLKVEELEQQLTRNKKEKGGV